MSQTLSLPKGRGTRIRTETKSSQRTRATITLYPGKWGSYLHFYIILFPLSQNFSGLFYCFLFACYNKFVNIKKLLGSLNLLAQSRKYEISLWQYPQFLFLVMGIITIAAILTAYAIGVQYIAEPEIVVLIVLILSVILLIITFTITQSFERLIEANRMKSEFVSIVSHQLRSPLSNLRWALELLMSGRLGKIEASQLDYFRILKDSSSRMRELVKDLLIVSRIEHGGLPLKKSEFSLADLIKGLILEFAPFAKAFNVEISFETTDNLPKIFADPSQLKLTIENFLDNAIRYVPARQSSEADRPMAGGKEKGKVEIKLKRKDNFLHFKIKDNGVGIPQEDQKYIFRKFFRSSNILRYQTQGTGLGLYIAKSIIEKSGGKIGFQSEEKKGTTFWFTIPIK